MAEFEKALAMKPSPVRLADAEEQISESPHLQSRAFFPGQLDQTAPSPLASLQLQNRLARLYAALGRTDKVLEMELAQCESDENRLQNLATVEQMAQRFAAAGQESRFTEWARRRLVEAKTPQVRANLAWQQRDYPAAMTNAAAVVAQVGYLQPARVAGALRQAGAASRSVSSSERSRRRVRGDAVARLKFLDLDDRLEGPEAIAALEALLATDAERGLPARQGRLESHALQELSRPCLSPDAALREEPAARQTCARSACAWPRARSRLRNTTKNLTTGSLGENGLDEFGNACLTLAIQHADAKGLPIGARRRARRTRAGPARGRNWIDA